MLKTMRKHARYFYFLFFLVILTFIFWGVGTVDKPTDVMVAEVDKEKISVEEYWRAYERVRNAYRDQYKEQFNEEMEKELNLKEKVLNTLLEEKVLLVSAKEMGINVSDKELQEAIMNDPNFMRDGVFRRDIYFRTLELNRLTPEAYENSLRQQLTILKMRRLIGSVVDIEAIDLKNIGVDDKAIADIKRALLSLQQDIVLKSYVEGIKPKMKIKTNIELIS